MGLIKLHSRALVSEWYCCNNCSAEEAQPKQRRGDSEIHILVLGRIHGDTCDIVGKPFAEATTTVHCVWYKCREYEYVWEKSNQA